MLLPRTNTALPFGSGSGGETLHHAGTLFDSRFEVVQFGGQEVSEVLISGWSDDDDVFVTEIQILAGDADCGVNTKDLADLEGALRIAAIVVDSEADGVGKDSASLFDEEAGGLLVLGFGEFAGGELGGHLRFGFIHDLADRQAWLDSLENGVAIVEDHLEEFALPGEERPADGPHPTDVTGVVVVVGGEVHEDHLAIVEAAGVAEVVAVGDVGGT